MTLLTERRGAVTHLVLNRPEKFNAIDLDLVHALHDAAESVASDRSVRAVVIRGAGKHFCAGADLDSVQPMRASAESFDGFLDEWHAAFDAIEALPVPVIAAVHGYALAGGFELTQVCDLMIVADNARIGDQHANFGLFPAGGSTQRLPRLIGERRAKWLLFSGAHVDAAQAVSLGLANEVVAADKLVERADEVAALLAARSPNATAATKRAVALGAGREVHDALAAERSIAVGHMTSDDADIGLDAFQNRKTPEFPDRKA